MQRLEDSRAGKWLISAAILVIVAGIAVANLPDGRVQQRLAKVTEPYMLATGLDQRWNMFAPEPRREILYLQARVTHADGSVTTWLPPSDGPLFGTYRDSHWRKFAEHAVAGANAYDGLFPSVARYAAKQETRNGSPAVSVTLVKRSAALLPPGKAGPDRTPFREVPYYTVDLR